MVIYISYLRFFVALFYIHSYLKTIFFTAGVSLLYISLSVLAIAFLFPLNDDDGSE